MREKERSDSYKLLADCYYLPDERLVRRLSSLDGSALELNSEVAKIAPKDEDLKSLKLDYSKLFVGPFRLLAPPYGSIYLEGKRRIMGNSTLDVKNLYREEGLKLQLKEAPDHITVELEFMHYLIFKEIEALNDNNRENADNYIEKQRSFLETHLGAWVPEFTEDVKTNAQTGFYKNLARLTKSFVEEDKESLFNR